MPTIHHRLDHKSDADLARHLDFILRLPLENKLVVLEKKSTNDKPHTHAIYSVDHISFSMLRQHWKKKFPDYDGKTDKCYQMKELSENEIHATEKYLCKGDNLETSPEVLLSKGKFTQDYITARHVEWWSFIRQPTQTIDEKLGGGAPVIHHHLHELVKPAKKKKPNFFEQVIEYLDRQHPERTWKVSDSKIMLAALYRMHGANFRPWGPQQLVNECRVLLAHYCYADFYTDAMEEVIPLAHWLR